MRNPLGIKAKVSVPVSGNSLDPVVDSRLGSFSAGIVGMDVVVVVVEEGVVASGATVTADWRVMVSDVVVLQLPFVVTTSIEFEPTASEIGSDVEPEVTATPTTVIVLNEPDRVGVMVTVDCECVTDAVYANTSESNVGLSDALVTTRAESVVSSIAAVALELAEVDPNRLLPTSTART